MEDSPKFAKILQFLQRPGKWADEQVNDKLREAISQNPNLEPEGLDAAVAQAKEGMELPMQAGTLAGSIKNIAGEAVQAAPSAVKIFSNNGIRKGFSSPETQEQLAKRLSGITVEPLQMGMEQIQPRRPFMNILRPKK